MGQGNSSEMGWSVGQKCIFQVFRRHRSPLGVCNQVFTVRNEHATKKRQRARTNKTKNALKNIACPPLHLRRASCVSPRVCIPKGNYVICITLTGGLFVVFYLLYKVLFLCRPPSHVSYRPRSAQLLIIPARDAS